jgi:CRP/FNR family transcriptional regulator, cyclic AMP receptor protein
MRIRVLNTQSELEKNSLHDDEKGHAPMLIADKRTALARHPLFSCLESVEREQLLMLGVERRFSDGQVIFRRGDAGGSMMLVLRGQIKISIVSEEGKELIFNLIPSGECFGEIALLDGRPRTADAIADGESAVLVLMRSDFIPFLERYPQVAIRLLAVLCQRVRSTSDFIESLAFQNPAARLARLLIKLMATHGVTTSVGVRITSRLSQQEIGSLIAASREGVNKQLRAWQAEELLKVEHGYITVLRPDKLHQLARSA